MTARLPDTGSLRSAAAPAALAGAVAAPAASGGAAQRARGRRVSRTSFSTTRPPGPEPLTPLMSMPSSRATVRASGEEGG